MKMLGIILTIVGLLILIFSHQIVFPGIEMLVGIETIVGKNAVRYLNDGSYIFTNPIGAIKWIVSVALSGVAITVAGIMILIDYKRKVDNDLVFIKQG